MVLDIVGKEVAEGLNEPDSIEALQQQNDEEFDIFDAPPTKKPIRKRRISVSIFIKNLYFSRNQFHKLNKPKFVHLMLKLAPPILKPIFLMLKLD